MGGITASLKPALDAAATAQATANTGITNSANAQAQADYATTQAATAQSTADIGVANAATAQATANTGVANAATAQATANGKVSKDNGASEIGSIATVYTNTGFPATATGATVSGAYLLMSDVACSAGSGSALPGVWRNLGASLGAGGNRYAIFQRIS